MAAQYAPWPIETLNSDNWKSWLTKTNMILAARGLLAIVEGKERPPLSPGATSLLLQRKSPGKNAEMHWEQTLDGNLTEWKISMESWDIRNAQALAQIGLNLGDDDLETIASCDRAADALDKLKFRQRVKEAE